MANRKCIIRTMPLFFVAGLCLLSAQGAWPTSQPSSQPATAASSNILATQQGPNGWVSLILDPKSEPTLNGFDARIVTVDVREVNNARGALVKFGQAVGIDMSNFDPATVRDGRAVSLKLKDVPFMQAFLMFQQQAGMVPVYQAKNQVRLTFTKNENAGLWCVCGPFAVVIDNISLTQTPPEGSVTVDPTNLKSKMVMTMRSVTEPGLAVTGKEKSFEFAPTEDDKHLPVKFGVEADGSITIIRAHGGGRVLPVLRGSFSPMVTKMDAVASNDPKQAQTTEMNGMDIEIDSPTSQTGALKYVVKYRPGKAMSTEKWRAAAKLIQETPVSASIGTSLASGKAGVIRTDGLEITFSFDVYSFSPHIVVPVPLETRSVHVPFEFHNVPLP